MTRPPNFRPSSPSSGASPDSRDLFADLGGAVIGSGSLLFFLVWYAAHLFR